MVKLVKKLGGDSNHVRLQLANKDSQDGSYSCGGWGDRQAPPWSLTWHQHSSISRSWFCDSAGLFSREGIQTFPQNNSENRQTQYSSADALLYQSHEIQPSAHTASCKHMDLNPSLCMQNPSWFVLLQFETSVNGSLGEIIPTNYQGSSSCWREWVTNQKPTGEVFPNTSPTVHLPAVISVEHEKRQ